MLQFLLVTIHMTLYYNHIQWNLRNKDTAEPCEGILISEVSLIQRFSYHRQYSIESYSGPRTLVLILEVSLIGGSPFSEVPL